MFNLKDLKKRFRLPMIMSVVGILTGIWWGIVQIVNYDFNCNTSGEFFAIFIILFPFLISFVCIMMLKKELGY
jgi:uncharacterized membrane protein YuzA (DUF378 family)